MSEGGGLEVDEVSALVIQLLFGRYSYNVDDVRPVHIFVLIFVLIVVVWVYVYFLRKRFRTYAYKLDHIGTGTFPIHEGSRGYQMMLNQSVNAYQLNRNCHPCERLNRGELLKGGVVTGDPGARVEIQEEKRKGSPKAQEDIGEFVVNFNRSVADSYEALQTIIKRRRPNLLYRHDRTIRDYVNNSIQKAFPKLRPELCEQYINAYERAVFGPHKLKASDFQDFQDVVAEIRQAINVNHNVSDDNAFRPGFSASPSTW